MLVESRSFRLLLSKYSSKLLFNDPGALLAETFASVLFLPVFQVSWAAL